MTMPNPAHIGNKRYARTCMPVLPQAKQGHHRHGRAKWYEGAKRGNTKPSNEGRTHGGSHTQPRGSTTHTKTKKQKLNIHNMHKRHPPHWPPRHKCKYVTCRATLRNEHEIRTATTAKRVTMRCNRDVPVPRCAHVPTPARKPSYIGSERERKVCPPVHAAASATRPPPPRRSKMVWRNTKEAKNDGKDGRGKPHTTTRRNNTPLQKYKNHTSRDTRNAGNTYPHPPPCIGNKRYAAAHKRVVGIEGATHRH